MKRHSVDTQWAIEARQPSVLTGNSTTEPATMRDVGILWIGQDPMQLKALQYLASGGAMYGCQQ